MIEVRDEVAKKSIEVVVASIVHVLQSIFSAVKTVTLYPPENPSVVRMVETAHDAITALIPPGGALDLSFIEDKLVVNGEALEDSMQKRAIINSFHKIMKLRRISSITFWDGMTKEELRSFLVVLGTKAPSIGADEQEEMDQLLKEQEIEHVEVDEQIYVAISKREKVIDARVAVESEQDVALKALKDEVFARFLAGEVASSDIDEDDVKDIVSRPDDMVAMVQGLISSKGWDTEVGTLPFRIDETLAILERVSGLVEQVDDPLVRNKLNHEVSKITGQIDAPQLTEMLLTSAGIDASSAELPKVILPLLEDKKLAKVVESVLEEYRGLAQKETDDDWPTPRISALKSIVAEATASADGEMAARLDTMISGSGIKEEKAGEAGEITGNELAKSLEGGADPSIMERARGPALVTAVKYLFENGEDELGAVVMKRLAVVFRRQKAEARGVAAREIWGLFRDLRSLGKEAYTEELIDEVFQVLEEEKGAVQAFSDLTRSMEGVAGGEGAESIFGDIESIDIGTGAPVSAKAIEKLMTSDTGKVVQAVFRSGEKAAQDAITKVLLGMEDRAVPALIDTAVGATDQETLESVAESLRQLQTDPVPQIAAMVAGELEVFQRVNLIKLVSMVGEENSVSVLNQLLFSEDAEVRKAVIHALGRLGGKQAFQMILTESAEMDIEIRALAVRELGNFRDYLAVKRVVEVVTPKKKGEFPEDESVMIAACRSLGDLRVRQAVPDLAEIARGGRRQEEYSESLRAVATTALGMIGGKEAQKALRHLVKDRSMLVRSHAKKALTGSPD